MPNKQYSSNNRQEFTILILRNMFLYKQTKFNPFLESVEGINSKTLSLRLYQLKNSDIIKRQVIPEVPIRIEYSLTEKGNALIPILEQLGEFSTQHCSLIYSETKNQDHSTTS